MQPDSDTCFSWAFTSQAEWSKSRKTENFERGQKTLLSACKNRWGPQTKTPFKSGLQNLNSARKEFDLEDLPPAHHNLYLSDEFFQHKSLKEFDNTQKELFSTHYFISRVLHQTFLTANKKDFIRNSHFVSFFSKAFPKNVGNYSPLKPLSFIKI